MNTITLAILLLTFQSAFATSTHENISTALNTVSRLRGMKPGQTYTLPARGQMITGGIDDFLRRRDPAEILESGLSSGCGDYAAAFYGLMQKSGAELLYVDSAELSLDSLLNRNNGHTAVAVKDPEINRWVLIDPTGRTLISYSWDRSSRIYSGPAGRFWIWYVGALEKYPARNHEDLKVQYDKALRSVSSDVWDRELVKLVFLAGESTRGPDGVYLNPKLPGFIKRYAKAYDDLGLKLTRRARVTIQDGGPNANGDCFRSGKDAWDCPIGSESAMSSRLFSYIDSMVSREFDSQ